MLGAGILSIQLKERNRREIYSLFGVALQVELSWFAKEASKLDWIPKAAGEMEAKLFGT